MGFIQMLPNYYSLADNQAICILLFSQLYLVIFVQLKLLLLYKVNAQTGGKNAGLSLGKVTIEII